MKHTIIVTDSVRNTNHLVRQWNREGNALADYEVLSIQDLSRQIGIYALAGEGRDLEGEVTPDAAAFLVQNLLLAGIRDGKVHYFHPESLDFAACGEICDRMNLLLCSHVTKEFAESSDQKLCDLKWLMDAYTCLLQKESLMDSAAFLNLALSDGQAEKWQKDSPCVIRTVIFGALLPKEQELLSGLGAQEMTEFAPFLSQEHTLSFVRAFGTANEVRHIAEEIRERDLSFGDVSICYASDACEGYLKSVLGAAGIPYAFVTGRAGEDEPYISLALSILRWAKGGFRYADLLPVFSSPILRECGGVGTYNYELNAGIGMSLPRFQAYISRTHSELEKNQGESSPQMENRRKFLSALDSLANIFAQERTCYGYLNAVIHWLGDHTSIRTENRKKDLDALRDLLQASLLIPASGQDAAVGALLELVSGLRVRDGESASAVSIARLGDPGASERRYNYFIGLSAKELEGGRPESPVLSDAELSACTDCGEAFLARNATERRVDALKRTIASAKGEVTLSCSEYDLVNLLGQTESSFYHDLSVKSGKPLIHAGFPFDAGGSPVIIRAALNTEEESDGMDVQGFLRQRLEKCTFSASSLMIYDQCRRHFYYKNILHLPDVQPPEYRPDRWLFGADLGNFFHGVLQEYVQACFIDRQKTSFDREVFDEIFRRQVDIALQKVMYVNENAFHTECAENRQKLTAYLQHLHAFFHDPPKGRDWRVEAVEYPVYATDGKTGIVIDPSCPDVRFGGRIDRIDSFLGGDGRRHYRIVDYKTSARARLEEETAEKTSKNTVKPAARRQHDVYMALFPQAEEFEYDLVFEDPENEQPIIITRSEGRIHAIAQTLEEDLYSGEEIAFPRGCREGKAGKDSCCSYCTYQKICRMYAEGQQ